MATCGAIRAVTMRLVGILGWRYSSASPFRAARPVAAFALSGAVVLLILVSSLAWLLVRKGHDEAIRDAARLTAAYGSAVVEPALEDGLLTFDPGARGRLSASMAQSLLSSPFVRTKVWAPDGTILMSDEPRLVGLRFPFDADAVEVMAQGGTQAEVSDSSKPENALDNTSVAMLEVYQRINTPNGTPVLFEAYMPFESVQAEGRQLWLTLVPLVVLGLALMWLFQLPMAWSMARRLRAGQDAQERLLRRTIEASDIERAALATDLHNGVVQTMAGMAFGLGALERQLPQNTPDHVRAQVSEASEAARASIRELRAMLVNLYPPTLRSSGLEPALNDLAAPLQARGITTEVRTDLTNRPPAEIEALLYRSAQEALRNVVKHSGAGRVLVSATDDNETWRLTVSDDGAGLDDGALDGGAGRGGNRMGLRLLGQLVEDVSGSLRIQRVEPTGTVLTVEVPRRTAEVTV
jgi:two-component system NarL family sensor kinase